METERCLEEEDWIEWSNPGSECVILLFCVEGETLTECVCFFQVKVSGDVSNLTKFFWVLQPKILTFGCGCSKGLTTLSPG